MIVDDLRAASPGFANLTQGAQVFRVPFEVCPFTTEPDGVAGLWWQGWTEEQQGLVPRTKEGLIECSWWRPPFQSMLIVSDRHEDGVLLVQQREAPGEFRLGSGSVTPDWAAVIALIAYDRSPEARRAPVFCALAQQVFAYEGFLYEPAAKSALSAKLTAFMSDLIGPGRGVQGEHVANLTRELEDIWAKFPDQHSIDRTNMTCIFSVICGLLGCKNVSTEVVHTPARLQAARRTRGSLPLISFRTLVIGGKVNARGVSRPGTGEPLALHWVRGHFKHYTAEKPLLGRAVGTYWWSPHLAGRADRVVIKEYKLEE
jgi:hypothetical protein